MTEDLITRMYTLLDQLPQSEQVKIHEQECVRNAQLERSWHDFLVEQFLSGNLSDAWKSYVLQIPQVKEEIVFQSEIQKGIRTLQDNALRTEIRRILPKKPLDGNKTIGRGPRFYTLVISIAAIGLLGIGVLLTRLLPSSMNADPGVAGVPVLMVEPFELKGVTEDEVVRGITHQLPMKLAATEGIYPVTHYAVDHVSERVPDDQIATTLKASYKVTGSIQRVDDDIQIEASLVNIKNNRSMWKERYTIDRDAKVIVTALNDVQYSMSLQIAQALKVNVSPLAHARMNMKVSENEEAVNWFLAGEHAWAERSKESLRESINLFRMALERDSASAIIRGYLALAYDTYLENDWGTDVHWEQAIAEANKTLAQDPDNPEALLVLGDHAETAQKDYQKAAEYFSRALRVHPNDAKIHQAIAELHLRTGELELGWNHIEIARIIEPEHRVVRWVETKYLTGNGLLENAREAADDLLAIYPDYPNIQNFYWQYYLSQGNYDQAIASIPHYDSLNQWRVLYMKALTYVDRGDEEATNALYPTLPEYLKPSIDLLLHVQKGQWDSAYVLLRQMLEESRFGLLAIFQTSDFQVFNKMKQNQGIKSILAEHGIKVNIIPRVTEPEM